MGDHILPDEYVHCDADYADETPREIYQFLNLIRMPPGMHDSYHCTAFSMLYEKNFFTFRRYSRKTRQSTNSRSIPFCRSAGLRTGPHGDGRSCGQHPTVSITHLYIPDRKIPDFEDLFDGAGQDRYRH